MARLAGPAVLTPNLFLLAGFENAGHPVRLEHGRFAALPGLEVEDALEGCEGDCQLLHLALVRRDQRERDAVAGRAHLAIAVAAQHLVVDEMDGDPLVAGGVDLTRRCARVEQDVLEAAQRDEGAPVVGAQVVDAGLHERCFKLPLGRVAVQRLAVQEAVDGVRHAFRIVGRRSLEPLTLWGRAGWGRYLTRYASPWKCGAKSGLNCTRYPAGLWPCLYPPGEQRGLLYAGVAPAEKPPL